MHIAGSPEPDSAGRQATWLHSLTFARHSSTVHAAMLHEGWKDIAKVFVLAMALDIIYQAAGR
jgi:hypothetical protein